MADEPGRAHRLSMYQSLRQWGIVVGVLGSLVGIPALVLAEVEFGLLTSLGLSGNLAFGFVVMIPGLTLGALSLVVMLGS